MNNLLNLDNTKTPNFVQVEFKPAESTGLDRLNDEDGVAYGYNVNGHLALIRQVKDKWFCTQQDIWLILFADDDKIKVNSDILGKGSLSPIDNFLELLILTTGVQAFTNKTRLMINQIATAVLSGLLPSTTIGTLTMFCHGQDNKFGFYRTVADGNHVIRVYLIPELDYIDLYI